MVKLAHLVPLVVFETREVFGPSDVDFNVFNMENGFSTSEVGGTVKIE